MANGVRGGGEVVLTGFKKSMGEGMDTIYENVR